MHGRWVSGAYGGVGDGLLVRKSRAEIALVGRGGGARDPAAEMENVSRRWFDNKGSGSTGKFLRARGSCEQRCSGKGRGVPVVEGGGGDGSLDRRSGSRITRLEPCRITRGRRKATKASANV